MRTRQRGRRVVVMTVTSGMLASSGIAAIAASAAPANATHQSASASARHASSIHPNPVTGLKASATSDTTIALSWHKVTQHKVVAVAVRRRVGLTPPAHLHGGTSVALVQPSTNTVADSNLTPSTIYSYSVFTLDKAGKPSSPTSTSVSTMQSSAHDPVTSFEVLGQTSTSIALGWANPGLPGFEGTALARSPGVNPPASLTADNVVAYLPRNRAAFVDHSLIQGATYSYSAFATYSSGYSEPATLTVTAAGTTVNPPGPVTKLSAYPTAGAVHLTWSDPPASNFDNVTIRRANGSTAPATVTDGVQVATLNTYTTTYDDPGLNPGQTYSYSVFAGSATGRYSAAATVTVKAGPADGPMSVCGTITGDQHWSPAAASVYVLTCNSSVAPGATLHIAAGSIVKAENTSLVVNGSLDVAGTSANPVTFTSLLDDSVGGDTNNDGDATSPTPGDWGGINSTTYVPSTGQTAGALPSVSIDHAALRYVGGYPTGTTVYVAAGGAVITNSSFVNNNGPAIDIASGSGSAPDIEGNTVSDGSGGIVVTGSGNTATAPTVSGNSITNVTKAAIIVASSTLDPSRLTGNTGHDDLPTALLVSGTLSADLTLPMSGLPWVVDGINAEDQQPTLTVPAGITMTLDAGATLKFNHSYYSTPDILVGGSLIADGTAASPVGLTSITDDSMGGDTNGDGSASAPVAGEWQGITALHAANTPAPVLDLEHTIVDYGGSIAAQGNVSTTLISDSMSDLAPASSYNYDAAAVRVAGLIGSSTDIESTTINRVTGNGIDVWVANDDTSPPTVTGNTVNHASGTAVAVAGPLIDPTHLSGNNGANDGTTGLQLAGTLSGNLTLPQVGLPVVIAADSAPCSEGGYGVYCGDGLVVAPGVTLTLAAGSVLKAMPGYHATYDTITPELIVEGTLNAVGTAVAPVTMTSVRDDSVGGDLGDGNGSVPNAGDWGGVLGAGNAVINLTHTVVTYSAGVVTNAGTDLTMSADQVTHTTTQYRATGAIDATAGTTGAIDIENTTVADTTNVGININATATGAAHPTVLNNTVTGATGEAVAVNGSNLDGNLLAGNTATNDGIDGLAVSGILTTNVTLPLPGMTWVVSGTSLCDACGRGSLLVDAGVTLTLNPGTVLKGQNAISDYDSPVGLLEVAGSLVSHGTAANPVVLTSIRDDTVGGDIDSQFGQNPPVAGDWRGIEVYSSQSGAGVVDLDHTTIRYASSVEAENSAQLTMSHSTIDHTLDGVFTELDAGGTVDIEDNTFTNTNDQAITVLSSSGRRADSPTIVNNTIATSYGSAIAVDAGDITPSLIHGNTATGAHPNAVLVAGTLDEDLTLPTVGLPWVIGSPSRNGGTAAPESLTIPAGVTMTVNPGAVVKYANVRPAGKTSAIDVQGSLISNATSNNPAVFTSLADDTVGGDTNDDNNASVAEPDDWYGIVADPDSSRPAPVISLPNTTIEYAWLALTVPSGNASITGTITNDVHGIAGPPTDSGGNCTNGSVTATDVDWGTPTGPGPQGTGPSVSGCVTYDPWVGKP